MASGRETREARRRAERDARRAERRRRSAEAAEIRAPRGPDLALLAPALAGLALATYLAFTEWHGGRPLACAPGSGCDLVQASRWATLLGVPVAAWGALAYAALAAIAVLVRPARLRAALALGVAGPALAVSVYLTGVSVFAIGAACPWCLASLGLVAACFAAAWVRRPRPPARPLPRAWGAAVGAASLLVVGGMHLHYQGVFDPAAGPEDPQLRALAEHLDAVGARFYGASWCPHCQEQKALFGASADRLPYVECHPDGPRTEQAPACREAGIEGYPTWVIFGEQHTGLLRPETLARLSRFRGDAAGGQPPGGGAG